MNITAPVTHPAGAPPTFSNLYVLFWSLFNFLVLIGIILLVIWFVKSIINYRKQSLRKMDQIIDLLQNKKDDQP